VPDHQALASSGSDGKTGIVRAHYPSATFQTKPGSAMITEPKIPRKLERIEQQ
jgi:hypothetical protein